MGRSIVANLRRSATARWAAYLIVVTGVMSGFSIWSNSIVFGWVGEEGRSVVRPAADSAVPQGVDYDRWLGPAPKRAFNKYRFHGTWRMFQDYGNGEIGDFFN